MESLKGKHKQVFDFGGISWAERGSGETPLRVPRNWLNAHKEVYGLESPAVNTIIGIAYSAFPLNAVDAVWQKYSLGERWKIKDGETGTWAVRNVFSNASAPYTDRLSTIDALKQRGTIFWQCNIALNGLAQQLAQARQLSIADVRADLLAGLNPGVRLVPSHVMALGLVQERGVTYVKI